MSNTNINSKVNESQIEFVTVNNKENFPNWANRPVVAKFFHETMIPYEDSIEDIERAMDYAFSKEKSEGGFLTLAKYDGKLAGALLMLNTGMGGYIPENLLLFVTVAPSLRGKGLGKVLIDHCVAKCKGSVKLHVDLDNPARRLYERIGFTNKYAEMRLKR